MVKSDSLSLGQQSYGAPNDTELKKFYPLGKRSAAFVIVVTAILTSRRSRAAARPLAAT